VELYEKKNFAYVHWLYCWRSFGSGADPWHKVHLRGTSKKSARVLARQNRGWKVRGSEARRFDSLVSHTTSKTAQSKTSTRTTAKLTDLAVGTWLFIHATAKDNG